MWNHASAAHASFAQTRRKAPVLARAAFSDGPFYVFPRKGRYEVKWHVWDDQRGFWWPPLWSEESAREAVAEAVERR